MLVVAPSLFGQTPLIQTGGVQNAASNIGLTSVSAQMLVVIKGQNLATSTEGASGSPLPFTLGGASVFFNGYPAPLLYASPAQINAQIPSALSDVIYSNQAISAVVRTAAGSSEAYPVPVTRFYDLGIFTQDQTGCGQAVAYNIHPDGSVSLNTPGNSLDPGKDLGLTFFLTGLGYFADRMDGVPWTYNPADNEAAPSGTFATSFGAPGVTNVWSTPGLQYVGPAPETVGIDQANVLGPWAGTPQGCHVPMFLYLSNGYGSSQLVDVSVQSGGGSCADPPDGTLGIIKWQEGTVSDTSGVSTSAAITAQFIQSNGLGFSPPVVGSQGIGEVFGGSVLPSPPLACDASLPSTLDGGKLTLTGPGVGSLTLTPSVQNGRTTYQITPPGGALQGGTYQVQGLGGSQVGPFVAGGQIPAPITVTTKLPAGSALTPDANFNYTFAWTGGEDESVVTIQIIVNGTVQVVTSVPASAGSVSIWAELPGFCSPGFNFFCEGPIPAGDTVEVIITQAPPNSPSLPFSAPGLALGGELIWTYTFDFKGLTG
jgi:uncharacterized protein (TIGR03437 family)